MNTQFARRQMVEQQIRTWDVRNDRVLELFNTLPRDEFVPTRYRRLAYADCAIPIGHGERMMVPSVEGRLMQALDPGYGDTVLEIGTGTGYLTACLAHLAARVTSVDIHRDFADQAASRLADHGIDNVSISTMDACRELPAGSFDVIAVTGSLPAVDQRFIEALNPGGRLFIVTGEAPVMQAERIVRGEGTAWHSTVLFETSLARLQNADEPGDFSF